MSFIRTMALEKVVYKSVPQNGNFGGPGPRTSMPPKGYGVRHTQTLILFFCLTNGYIMRAHLSVSVVAMTSVPTNHNIMCYKYPLNNFTETNVTSEYSAKVNVGFSENETNCADSKESNESLKGWSVYQTYDWKKPTQEMILYSFFMGYTAMVMPMGLVSQRFGGKIPIMIALGANGVLSILTPWMPIFGGWLAVSAIRFLQGMAQAAFYPSIHTLLGRWAPLSERGRLTTYVYTGSQFGVVLSFQLAGLFAGTKSLGWPFTFWLGGFASLACCCLLAWFGAATPHEHPNISFEELTYIMGDVSADVAPKRLRTPWRHILTSRPVWGLVATHSAKVLGFITILTQIPHYMNSIHLVEIKKNGVISSLPYIAMYFMTLLFGYLSDCCVNRNIMSIANIRRVANTIGMMVSGMFLVAFSYVNTTPPAVILMILCLGSHSGIHVGCHINQIDLAPNFAGPIMALGHMLGNLLSLTAPVMVANIIGNDVTNQHSWQTLFIIIAAIMSISNLVFLVFVEGTVQPWNFYGDVKIEAATNDERELKEKTNLETNDTITKSL